MGIGQKVPRPPASADVTSVGQTDASTELLAERAERKGAVVFNAATKGWLYVKLGPGATTSDYTVRLLPNNSFSLQNPAYTGQITGVWSGPGSGSAKVTELY